MFDVTPFMTLDSWNKKASILKAELDALYLCSKDPRIPWYAKALLLIVLGYALSPVDLIPDFIPVIGYLDDIILIPMGIACVVRMIPKEVLEECRKQARSRPTNKGKHWIAAIVILFIWLLAIMMISKYCWQYLRGIKG